MANTVRISNLKSIKSLEFEIPSQGAFVVTGANGCGKTSLLIALHRMGAPNAFQTGLPGARSSNGIDGLGDARIDYDIAGKSVSYRYANTRWSATPKSHSSLVSQAFTDVAFLKADSSRVEPTINELRNSKKSVADKHLIEFLNTVFDTKKFDGLHRINLQGRKTVAHLIETTQQGAKKRTFYSEKNFSLGELCVMRLAQKLLAARNAALYIIDEFEMALHPAAQIRLFEQIEKIAKARNCTALVSTHSSSLIKSVRRANIIYLDNIDGAVTVHRNVYPTFALQHLALDEEDAPDRLILVEDISAKYCLEAMWNEYRFMMGKGQNLPTVQCVVIGGYKEVLRFLERSPSIIPKMTKCVAALDEDAEAVCVPPKGLAGNAYTVPQALYESLKSKTVFLPWTPEVGFCNLLRENLQNHLSALKQATGVMDLKISVAMANAHNALADKLLRDKCKETVDLIAKQISAKRSWSLERSHDLLFKYLVEVTCKENKPLMMELFGKLFK